MIEKPPTTRARVPSPPAERDDEEPERDTGASSEAIEKDWLAMAAEEAPVSLKQASPPAVAPSKKRSSPERRDPEPPPTRRYGSR